MPHTFGSTEGVNSPRGVGLPAPAPQSTVEKKLNKEKEKAMLVEKLRKVPVQLPPRVEQFYNHNPGESRENLKGDVYKHYTSQRELEEFKRARLRQFRAQMAGGAAAPHAVAVNTGESEQAENGGIRSSNDRTPSSGTNATAIALNIDTTTIPVGNLVSEYIKSVWEIKAEQYYEKNKEKPYRRNKQKQLLKKNYRFRRDSADVLGSPGNNASISTTRDLNFSVHTVVGEVVGADIVNLSNENINTNNSNNNNNSNKKEKDDEGSFGEDMTEEEERQFLLMLNNDNLMSELLSKPPQSLKRKELELLYVYSRMNNDLSATLYSSDDGEEDSGDGDKNTKKASAEKERKYRQKSVLVYGQGFSYYRLDEARANSGNPASRRISEEKGENNASSSVSQYFNPFAGAAFPQSHKETSSITVCEVPTANAVGKGANHNKHVVRFRGKSLNVLNENINGTDFVRASDEEEENNPLGSAKQSRNAGSMSLSTLDSEVSSETVIVPIPHNIDRGKEKDFLVDVNSKAVEYNSNSDDTTNEVYTPVLSPFSVSTNPFDEAMVKNNPMRAQKVKKVPKARSNRNNYLTDAWSNNNNNNNSLSLISTFGSFAREAAGTARARRSLDKSTSSDAVMLFNNEDHNRTGLRRTLSLSSSSRSNSFNVNLGGTAKPSQNPAKKARSRRKTGAKPLFGHTESRRTTSDSLVGETIPIEQITDTLQREITQMNRSNTTPVNQRFSQKARDTAVAAPGGIMVASHSPHGKGRGRRRSSAAAGRREGGTVLVEGRGHSHLCSPTRRRPTVSEATSANASTVSNSFAGWGLGRRMPTARSAHSLYSSCTNMSVTQLEDLSTCFPPDHAVDTQPTNKNGGNNNNNNNVVSLAQTAPKTYRVGKRKNSINM